MPVKKGVKAQVSLEFMIIIGFSLLIIMPIIAIFFTEYQSFTQGIYSQNAQKVARTISTAAQKAYYNGEPSQTTVSIQMPEQVQDVIISNNQIMLRMKFGQSITDVYEIAGVNVTGNISTTPGIKNILVQAHDTYVNITEQ